MLKARGWGLPWWSNDKVSPSNAGDAGSIPGQGTKIPHTVGQPGPLATNYTAQALRNPRVTTREEKTRTPQLERK